MKYHLKPLHILTLVIILVALLISIEILFSPLDNYKQEVRLQHTLTEEKWLPYSDKELGLSFEYPESWKVSKDSSNKLMIYSGITFVTIEKNPNPEEIQSLLKDTHYKFGPEQTRMINGTIYTLLQVDQEARNNFKTGRYMISANKDLLIQNIYGSEVNNSHQVQQAEDKVIDRIVSSLKLT